MPLIMPDTYAAYYYVFFTLLILRVTLPEPPDSHTPLSRLFSRMPPRRCRRYARHDAQRAQRQRCAGVYALRNASAKESRGAMRQRAMSTIIIIIMRRRCADARKRRRFAAYSARLPRFEALCASVARRRPPRAQRGACRAMLRARL